MTNGGFIPTNRVDLGTPTNVGGIPVDRDNKIAKVTEDDVRLSAGLVPGAVYIDSDALDQSIADVKSDMQSALGFERTINPGIAGQIWNNDGELRFSLGPTILTEDGRQFFQPDGSEFLLSDE